MDVKNVQRGKAYLMARFDVNFGAMTIKGFELVKVGDKVFVSEPYNLWKPKNDPNADLQRFSYVWFNGDKGKRLQGEIANIAKDEYRRRSQAPRQEEQNAWDFEEDLPF
jgi:hypothetical protein